MGISSVSGSSIWTQMQQFQSGKTNLQKEDLQQLTQQTQQTTPNQSQGTSPLDSLLAAFDKIDKNQDGISIDELKSFIAENGMPGNSQKTPPSGPPPSIMVELKLQPMGGADKKTESISKEQLVEIQNQMESQGIEVPEKLSQMISNFDSLDANQDSKLSADEMMATNEQKTEGSANGLENKLQELLKQIQKYTSDDAQPSSRSASENKDMTIKFMRAINQYTNISSSSSQESNVPAFDMAA
ncbi:MAG: hypothetical protein KKB51_05085 [Candidatus Riflebacteria bacterium]|nr:hypothetical protein [Candidatus Riflebacteria bacterium]